MARKVIKKMNSPLTENQSARQADISLNKKALVAGSVKKAIKKKAVKKPTRQLTRTVVPEEQLNNRLIPEHSTPLTAEELEHFRRLLLEKLAEITGDVKHIESETLKSSRGDAAGDLSSMPIHMADIGSDNYEQEFALGLMDGERIIVREIIAALKRIEKGTYGICEGTGEPIPLTRLNGIPWTRYCLKYAALQEKRKTSQREQGPISPDEYAALQDGSGNPESNESLDENQ